MEAISSKNKTSLCKKTKNKKIWLFPPAHPPQNNHFISRVFLFFFNHHVLLPRLPCRGMSRNARRLLENSWSQAPSLPPPSPHFLPGVSLGESCRGFGKTPPPVDFHRDFAKLKLRPAKVYTLYWCANNGHTSISDSQNLTRFSIIFIDYQMPWTAHRRNIGLFLLGIRRPCSTKSPRETQALNLV